MAEIPVIERRRLVGMAGHRGDVGVARSALDDPDSSVRASALRALRRCDALDERTLTRVLADPDPQVRTTAVELAATAPAVAIAPLLDDPDHRVVEMTAWAIGERPPDDEAARNLVAVAGGHTDPLCREAAIAALGALGTGLEAVLAALEDKPAVRRRAVIALAAFEGPDVDAALERARNDKDRQVRDTVDELLGPGDEP